MALDILVWLCAWYQEVDFKRTRKRSLSNVSLLMVPAQFGNRSAQYQWRRTVVSFWLGREARARKVFWHRLGRKVLSPHLVRIDKPHQRCILLQPLQPSTGGGFRNWHAEQAPRTGMKPDHRTREGGVLWSLLASGVRRAHWQSCQRAIHQGKRAAHRAHNLPSRLEHPRRLDKQHLGQPLRVDRAGGGTRRRGRA